MKLFFDEDMGSRIPKAVKSLEAPCESVVYPSNYDPIRLGTKDPEWLPWVGENGYLAISTNRHILEMPSEFELIPRYSVGIIFLDYGSYRLWEVMSWIIRRWEWLELVDRTIPRPFVYVTGVIGTPARYDLGRGPARPRPYRRPPDESTDPDGADQNQDLAAP